MVEFNKLISIVNPFTSTIFLVKKGFLNDKKWLREEHLRKAA